MIPVENPEGGTSLRSASLTGSLFSRRRRDPASPASDASWIRYAKTGRCSSAKIRRIPTLRLAAKAARMHKFRQLRFFASLEAAGRHFALHKFRQLRFFAPLEAAGRHLSRLRRSGYQPFFRGEGGIKRALRALLPGSAKRRQEDGHAQHAFKARLSLTKALLKVKPVDDSTGFRERRRRDLNSGPNLQKT